ncbi:AsmA family protein [Ferrimonas senticii]|uniref:AsmA family protein n=1 Tax=Ferrimonas senticii TaxID=394566 RepID=UPI0003FF7EA8|nr:AsmA family protein [Ferrimonas senticii]
MKVLKWLLLSLLLLVVAGIAYVTLLLDLNQFKPTIAAKVEQASGRQLTIDGDIGLSFYPTLGLELQGVALSNIPGESLPPMLVLDSASLGVKLMALLRGEVQVESLLVEGVQLTNVTLADGRSSTTGLGNNGSGTAPADSNSPQPETAPSSAPSWRLDQLVLRDLEVVNDNRAADAVQQLQITELTLTDLEPGRAAPLALAVALDDGQLQLRTEASAMLVLAKDFTKIQIDNWQQQLHVVGATPQPVDLKLALQADLDLVQQQLALPTLRIDMADFLFEGSGQLAFASSVPKLTFSGNGSRLDLTPFMPPQPESASTEAPKPAPTAQQPAASESASEQPTVVAIEPDLRGLKAINADLQLSLQALQVNDLLIEAIATKVKLQDGVLRLEQLDANGFDGAFSLTAELDGRQVPASYQFKQTIKGLQIKSLLHSVADLDLLEGIGTLSLTGQGRGLAGDALVKGLRADGQLQLADGALHGINIAKAIRDASAKLQGKTVANNSDAEKTDFASLAMSLRIKDGNLELPNFDLASPLLRVDGDGSVGLLDQQLGVNMIVALVGSLEGQGGADLSQLRDLPIPIAISGSAADPKIALDLKQLQRQFLDQEKQKLQDKVKDKLMDKLFGG